MLCKCYVNCIGPTVSGAYAKFKCVLKGTALF